ncbi:chemotaxis protein CheB [Methylobacterium sp. E-025]|uniref:chemotaxis protein CheB n=1 Tax=Methylobacterium sp. E-025 TaxID=2836561 RepID=UPI001FBA93A8|nr:chemotaxis protein CheB [Methylobacterium sp. E-025]MCJ2114984.1 chemotaxis protein CheB [Methylobacterium sp. E-025]
MILNHTRDGAVDEGMGPIVIIAASAGGLTPIKQIVAALPAFCSASVFIVWHTGSYPSIVPEILSMTSHLPVGHGEDGQHIEAGRIYVAPPDKHMYLDHGVIRLDHGAKVHFTRPAADPLFVSAAEAYGEHVIGIVLSGYGGDGADGLATVKALGGLALVQKPEEAEQPSMPWAAILADHPDASLPVEEIAARVAGLC